MTMPVTPVGEPVEPVQPPVTEPTTSGDPGGKTSSQDSFPREVVEDLRREAAGYRVKAQRADEAVTRLTQSMIQSACSNILVDPSDLPASVELLGQDGWPSTEAIVTAARALAATKPHLAKAGKPTGDVGQGHRGVDARPLISLQHLLRAGAGS